MKDAEIDVALRAAKARIIELEELLEDRNTLVDIQAESIHELEGYVRVLKGQLQQLRVDRRVEVCAS